MMFFSFRVFPELYLDVRETLVAECAKNGGLRLADARPVVKIDVNKTRKLYDFFIARKLIYKPPK
jgi:transcriptional adapter 2-alpha